MTWGRKRSGAERRSRGVATVELALLIPFLFLTFISLVQLIIYIQSANSTQYAAFAAARAYQVYGTRTLAEISYPRYGSNYDETNEQQTIAEAAAEKIIFESLPWEHRRVKVRGAEKGSFDRYYLDGNDTMENGTSMADGQGVVKVNFLTGDGDPYNHGVEVVYCMPVTFPGIDHLYDKVKDNWPCKGQRSGKEFRGVAITKEVRLGREPLEK